MLQVQLLPYDLHALQPVMGSDALFYHHDKHYAAYVSKANELLPAKWARKKLSEIVALARKQRNTTLFNQVAQVWNHEFFFKGLSLHPDDKEISSRLLDLIRVDFANIDVLKAELVQAAMARFGSGWVWLILDNGHLKIQSTSNAETPCGLKGLKPLWTLDVWEHAYYLDYQNRRADYASNLVEKAMNWKFIDANLAG